MDVVCVASNRHGVGKTALAAVMVRRLLRVGGKVAYFRPPLDDSADPDTSFIQGVIIGDQAGGGQAPAPARGDRGEGVAGLDEVLRQAEGAAERAAAEEQKLVLEVPNIAPEESPWQQCLQVTERVNGSVLAVLEYSPEIDGNRLEAQLGLLKGRLGGVVANLVPRYRVRDARQRFTEVCERLGTPLLGVVPEDRTMMAPTVGQLAQHLDARWILGEASAEELVCHVLIGGNIMDWGPTYFGQHEDKAVVVRGDRPDIQIAALATPTACLVLTGGHQPTQYVYYEAQRREVPLLVVEGDTLSMAEALGALQERAAVHHRRKVDRFCQLLEEHGDVAVLEGMLA